MRNQKSKYSLETQIIYKEIELEKAIERGDSKGTIKRLKCELSDMEREMELHSRTPTKVPKNYDNRLF